VTPEERAQAHREMAEAMLGSIDALVTSIEQSEKGQAIFRTAPAIVLRSMIAVLRARHVDGLVDAKDIIERAVPK
jgi:cobalamin synthase